MSDKLSDASKQSLINLHDALAREFAARIASGTATSADLSAARQFLRDNSIDCAAVDGNPISNLVLSLPFVGGDEEEDRP